MLLLALESTTSLGSIALIKDGVLIGEESSSRQRSHSEFLNAALSRLIFSLSLDLKEVEKIAVTTGPGSFTGVRVAGSLAKSLAYSLNKEIWAIDSLSVLGSMYEPVLKQIAVEPARTATLANQKFVSINAFKNMVYCSCLRGANTLIGPSVIELTDLDQFINTYFPEGTFTFLGDALELILPVLSPATKGRLTKPDPLIEHPTAAAVGQLYFAEPLRGQTLDWKSFVPLYLRGSEAEENLRLRASEKL